MTRHWSNSVNDFINPRLVAAAAHGDVQRGLPPPSFIST